MDLKFPRVIEEGRSPTVNDDESQGIIVGQPWVDVNTNDYFICTDIATGSATWDEIASKADLEDIIDNAPAVLDTLSELSTALQNNPAIITDIQASLATMLADLTSLQGDVAGPPVLHTHPGTEVVQDTNHRFVTDAQLAQIGTGGSGGGLGVGSVVNVSTNYSASVSEFIAVNAITPITITLPISPSIGDVLIINDSEGKSHNNNITILRNGNLIQNLEEDFILDIRNGQVTFTFDSTGWLVDLGGAVIAGNGDQRLLYPWMVHTANYDAKPLDRIIADTSVASFTINLPIAPKQGDQVEISPGSNWMINNLIIASPGTHIIGLAEPLELDTSRSIVMIYTATSYGWTVANYNNASLIGVIGGEAPRDWKIIENSYNAQDKDRLVAKSNGIFTITLPANPVSGCQIEIIPGSEWETNNIIIDNGTRPIMGTVQQSTLDISRAIVFVYTDDTYGWTVGNYTNAGVVVDQTVSGGSGSSELPWIVKTSNYTANENERIIADTSAGQFTITMPSSLTIGMQVEIAPGSDLTTTSVLVESTKLFHGQAGPFNVDTMQGVTLIYTGETYGWTHITDTATPVINVEGGGGGSSELPWIVKTASYTANENERIIADTSGGTFDITMPNSPTIGMQIEVAPGSDWETNTPQLISTDLFHGQPGPFELNVLQGLTLVYTGSGYGWTHTLNPATPIIDNTSVSSYTHPTNHAATMITEDTTHRFVTDAQMTTWDAGGGGSYTHPTNHAASIITQDASNRFVTDAQIATWDAGGSTYTHPANHAISVITGLQTALDAKAPSTGIDAAAIANTTVSNTEFQYLNGASSNIQSQIDDVTSAAVLSDAIPGSYPEFRIQQISTTYLMADIEIASIQIGRAGTYTVKFNIVKGNSGTSYITMRRNGVTTGSQWNTTNASDNFSRNIAVLAGEELQIYARHSHTQIGTVRINDFRIESGNPAQHTEGIY